MPQAKPPAQSLSTKRAEVEFHNFASLGEPERALRVYREENERRGAVIRSHREFLGELTPFLEIGANAGHTSYMLANEFGASGFALDISADALRYGITLMDSWQLSRAPVRLTGDAANLPFADGSLRLVMAFQMLSQFQDIERVFLEVKRVLAPGGVFLFAEEPMRRLLTLRLYRCPYVEQMKPWERKLHSWGLLGFLVRDVIGAHQEESFGIRQNHTMGLHHWHQLVKKHFSAQEYELFIPQRGWAERWVRNAAVKLDPHRSEWRAARLLGGTLAAMCKKAGEPAPSPRNLEAFEGFLRCPDCASSIRRDEAEQLHCTRCSFTAPFADGVYNLLPSDDQAELYPGERDDVIDFSQPGHAAKLGEGWHELEGVFGNKYRWIGPRATATLRRMRSGPQQLRVRGHVQESTFERGVPVTLTLRANGETIYDRPLSRPGLFVIETAIPDAATYELEILASPAWQAPPDTRTFTVNLSLIRLVPQESPENQY